MARQVCDHTHVDKRLRVGLIHIWKQLQCVACLRPVGEKMLAEGADLYLPRWKRRAYGNKKKRAYQNYLRSSEWKKLRERILARDDWTCQGCGVEASQVDHLTYERFGAEWDRDLQAVCGYCNLERRAGRLIR